MSLTDASRCYFIVLKNSYGHLKNTMLGEFIDRLGVHHNDDEMTFYGKFNLPINQINGTVHEYVHQAVADFEEYEIITVNNDLYLFKSTYGLYFHITWKIVHGMCEFVIIHGLNYSNDENGVYVFNDDDDRNTVVADEFEDSYFDVNDMTDI